MTSYARFDANSTSISPKPNGRTPEPLNDKVKEVELYFSEQVECCSESISTKKINFEEVLEGSQDRLSRNVNLVFKRK